MSKARNKTVSCFPYFLVPMAYTTMYFKTSLVFITVFINGNVFATERWSALTRYTSVNGWSCIIPCEQRGQNYFWCYIGDTRSHWSDQHGKWGLCSPSQGTTYNNKPCENSCEAYRDYFWCYTDARKNWDYCGQTLSNPVSSLVEQYKTINGEDCLTECSKKDGTSYNWCRIPGGSWNYCSAEPGFDNYGHKCSDTCSYRGESYMWCHLEKGSWGYCGIRSISSRTYYTYLGSKCITPCVLSSDGSKNECYDASQKLRDCSQILGHSVDDLKCITSCDTRGGSLSNAHSSYNWCDTVSGWRYCSDIFDDPYLEKRWGNKRVYFSLNDIPLTLTRTNSRENIYVHRDDQGNNQVTFFERLQRDGNNAQFPMGNDRNLIDWLHACLANWRANSYPISPQNSQRLAFAGENGDEETRGVRLDQQSRYTRGGVEYVNLQVQVNGIGRVGGRSTTMAEAQVPVSVVQENPEQVIQALLTSAYQEIGVHVGRFPYDPRTRRPGGNH